jgi:GNAT superfamily N-acetyltransferase
VGAAPHIFFSRLALTKPHARLPTLLDALGKKDGFEGYTNLRVDVLYDHGKMVGGAVYGFYQHSGCGLIDYFCVANEYRGKGYGTLLVRAAEREIHEIALRLGRPYANAIFMETNMPHGPEHGHDFTVQERFKTFDQLGYKCVDYRFMQPPLEEHKQPSDTLFLTVCVNPPHKMLRAKDGHWALQMKVLREWMVEYWNSVDVDVTDRKEYIDMLRWFQDNKHVPTVAVRDLIEAPKL